MSCSIDENMIKTSQIPAACAHRFELNWLLIISDEPRLAKLQTWTIQRWSSCLWRHLWLLWAFRHEFWEWNQRCKSQMQSQSAHMQCRSMVFFPRLTNHLHCNMMQHVTLLPTCRCRQGTGASISGSASKGNATLSVFQTFSEDQSHATYFACLLGKHPNISTSNHVFPTFHQKGSHRSHLQINRESRQFIEFPRSFEGFPRRIDAVPLVQKVLHVLDQRAQSSTEHLKQHCPTAKNVKEPRIP